MVQVVVLPYAGGDARTLKTTALAAGWAASGESIAKMLRKTKNAELLGLWEWPTRGTLQLWGWTSGKAGQENKHELPPPHDEVLLFGDIVIVLVGATGSVDMTAEMWSEFVEAAHEGFDEVESESESESESEMETASESDNDEDDTEDGDAEESESESEADAEDGDAEEEEELVEEGGDDCYEDDDDGGGAKRRSARRRTATDNEYRNIELGLRACVKLPTAPNKRAPRWQTAPELEPEEYDI